MSYLNSQTMAEDDDCFGRPQYDRQRSYSAPEFRVIDVTATEAVMICSAAARASDRRRGRRDRRHVSLDVDAERSISRPREEPASSDEDVEVETALSEVPELEEEEDDQQTPTITLTNYAHNMALLMQQRIHAIQIESTTTNLLETPMCSPPICTSIPDDQLCSSPPSEYEENDVMEIDSPSEVHTGLSVGLLRPPLRSAFSAWSSAASTPATPEPPHYEDERPAEPSNYFNFPEPPKSRVDSIFSTTAAAAQQHNNSKPHVDRPTTSYRVQHQSNDQDLLSNYTLDRPASSSTTFSTPIFSCGQYFPPSSTARGSLPLSPINGPSMTRPHHVC